VTTAAELDADDPLGPYRARFLPADGVAAYLDGNSLGRPLVASAARITRVVQEEWATRLIRGWDDGWLDLPLEVGDAIGRVCLGAAPGQTAIGDSTTVLLYKVLRAAIDARPARDEVVIDRESFPTDRYVLEGIAADRGLAVRWIDTPHDGGVTVESVAAAIGPRTALALFNVVAYRSAYLADVAAITAQVHDAGALAVWDLSHAAGVVPLALDDWAVDLAVGCGYKYLNGGPGAPAFAYVAQQHLGQLAQPIHGWLGSARPFEMGQGYVPAQGIRAFLSGTPPILGMQAIRDMVELIDEVGMDAVRTKSVRLTAYAVELADRDLPEAVLGSPRDPQRRGSHITLDHPLFESLMPELWRRGIIPDFRRPDGIRLGLSPLSTSYAEVELAVSTIAELVPLP
jgi:kynureninase